MSLYADMAQLVEQRIRNA